MLNKVILVGRFTRDPELRSTPQGTSTCSFSLAVDRNYQSGEKQADFINCVAWRQTAEFISKYFQKGNMICVEGSIQTRSWKGDDSKTRYATEVVVDRSYFVESKKSAAQSSEQPAGYEAPSTPYEPTQGSFFNSAANDDDLPF